jgi:hypothetical protein
VTTLPASREIHQTREVRARTERWLWPCELQYWGNRESQSIFVISCLVYGEALLDSNSSSVGSLGRVVLASRYYLRKAGLMLDP